MWGRSFMRPFCAMETTVSQLQFTSLFLAEADLPRIKCRTLVDARQKVTGQIFFSPSDCTEIWLIVLATLAGYSLDVGPLL